MDSEYKMHAFNQGPNFCNVRTKPSYQTAMRIITLEFRNIGLRTKYNTYRSRFLTAMHFLLVSYVTTNLTAKTDTLASTVS